MAQDYGYFGKGSAGYAHYMQTFNSTAGKGGGGGNGGCLGMVCLFLLAGGGLFKYFLR